MGTFCQSIAALVVVAIAGIFELFSRPENRASG